MTTTPDLNLEADVVVLGGGPAGTWAAVKAAEAGASVVLLDKGYCGASGATAAAGTGVWYVPPTENERESAMASREALGGHLADRRWMRRVLDETWARVPELDEHGYPFPTDPTSGLPVRTSLQGPDYMKRQRQRVARAGVRILDHSPATELLLGDDGSVVGVNGVQRQSDQRYTVRAGATVVAAGGCAFLSRTLGCNVDTGESYLFGVEAGAELSGMEFSNSYSLAPAATSLTKSAFYHWGTFYREDGTVIEGAGSQKGRSVIARTLLTEPVYCRIDRITDDMKSLLPSLQPNFFQPFVRLGIDPFTQLFPVTLILEGTVRGTGGLRVVDDSCATSVPGLFAAGDAATRQEICGAFTGGGSHNAAWAISSGVWAGRAAADHARRIGPAAHTRTATPSGTAGLRPTGRSGAPEDYRDLVAAVQGEVMPYDKNFFRTGDGLTTSLEVLDAAWASARSTLAAPGVNVYKAREAAAMVATARWMYRSALERTETRGMHRREDHPDLDAAQRHRILTGGLDEVWTAIEPLAADRLAPDLIAS